jgi:ribose 5-phosphate isomerase B
MKITTIAIASDHRGTDLKNMILQYLTSCKIIPLDLNSKSASETQDYPLITAKVSKAILAKEADYGILICNTGIGMSIAANRFKNIRAALCYNKEYATMAKKHNDANILIFGAGHITAEEACACIKVFLETSFEEGRHLTRIKLIEDLK